MATHPPDTQILLVESDDRPGLVHQITGALYREGANIVGNQEFVDRESNRFFMRTEFLGAVDCARLLSAIRDSLPAGARVHLSRLEPKRIVVLATREHHCLADVLVRHAFSELNARLLGVISNHDTLRSLVSRFEIPFHHVPHEGRDRGAHEKEVLTLLRTYQPDFVVLAKYMRILSSGFVGEYPNRLVNIHHSFLPAFVGARPYHQAFDRGVKVIGATAHFVTEHLDEGPILVQQVIPIDHTHTAEDLQRAGRDVEQLTLSRALRLVFEDRVFLCGRRTVILD